MGNWFHQWFKRLARLGVFGLLVWCGLFRWNVFNGYGDGTHQKPMYSPNCEYYITTHQTVWERLFYSSWPYLTGTATLHDKTGRVLYSGKSDFEEHSPTWRSFVDGGGEVSMWGVGPDGHWLSQLPTEPGSELKARNCAKFDEETQTLQAMTQQPELTVPLDECSFKFSNLFHGWFLRGRRYVNFPVVSYEGTSPLDTNTKVEIRFDCLKDEEHREIWSGIPVQGSIKAVNATGEYKLNVYDEGEIAFRGCLPNGKYVLCVNEYSVGNKKHPEHDLTPQMLQLLRSVEFVDEAKEGRQ